MGIVLAAFVIAHAKTRLHECDFGSRSAVRACVMAGPAHARRLRSHHSEEPMRLSMHLALAALAALAFAAPAHANDAPAPVATHKPECAHDKDAKGDAKHD